MSNYIKAEKNVIPASATLAEASYYVLQSIEEDAFSNCVSIDKVMIEDVSSWCHLSFPKDNTHSPQQP